MRVHRLGELGAPCWPQGTRHSSGPPGGPPQRARQSPHHHHHHHQAHLNPGRRQSRAAIGAPLVGLAMTAGQSLTIMRLRSTMRTQRTSRQRVRRALPLPGPCPAAPCPRLAPAPAMRCAALPPVPACPVCFLPFLGLCSARIHRHHLSSPGSSLTCWTRLLPSPAALTYRLSPSPVDCEFLKKWDRLLALEEAGGVSRRPEIWSMTGELPSADSGWAGRSSWVGIWAGRCGRQRCSRDSAAAACRQRSAA